LFVFSLKREEEKNAFEVKDYGLVTEVLGDASDIVVLNKPELK
jgi:hypothetical protein